MKQSPRQVRLDPEVDLEVKKIAEVTGLPQTEVIRQLIKAGAQAVKESGGELNLPLRLQVIEREIPKSSSSTSPSQPAAAGAAPVKKKRAA